MGKVLSHTKYKITRSLNRINVENRAHKIISQDKPIPAPKHAATQIEIEMLMRDHKGSFETLKKKDIQLDTNLKDVYVKSYDPEPIPRKFGKPSEKMRLPSSRPSQGEESVLKYFDVDVPEGKLSLKHAMEILAVHKADPKMFNVNVIAKQYKLSLKDTENILKYFSSFNFLTIDKDKMTESQKKQLPKVEEVPLIQLPKKDK